jgi:hypothetical protein
MNDFLNKLKARINNLELSNHTEVNEDALWNSIQVGITEDVKVENPRNFLLYVPFLLATLFLIGFTGLYFKNNKVSNEQQKNVSLNQQNSIDDLMKKSNSTPIPGVEMNDLDQPILTPKDELDRFTFNSSVELSKRNNSSPENNSKKSAVNSHSTISKNSTVRNKVIATQDNNNKDLQKIIVLSNNSVVEIENKITTDQNNEELQQNNVEINSSALTGDNEIIAGQNNEESQKDIIPSNHLAIEIANERLMVSMIPSVFSNLDQNQSRKSLDLERYFTMKEKEKRKISLGLFTGVHLLHSNLASNSADDQIRKNLVNAGLKPQLGCSAGAEITIQLFKNLNLTSGIEYVKSVEQFNYSTKWDTTFQNGQNTINQSSERIVKHYNRHSFFSVPVLLGMEFQKGKFEFGANIGVGFNFIRSQRGRTLDNNLDLTDFPLSENSNLSPRPDFYLSYQIRPYLSYQLKKNLKIQLRPDFRIQNYGKLEFYNNMKFSSILTGVQTAIVFDLFK